MPNTPGSGDTPDAPGRLPRDPTPDFARDAAVLAEATRNLRESQCLAAAAFRPTAAELTRIAPPVVNVAAARGLPFEARLDVREIALLRQLDMVGREADRRLAELPAVTHVLVPVPPPTPDPAAVRALGVLADDQRRVAEWVRAARRRTAAFDAALVKLGWPPPAHIPATAADALAEYYEAGELTAEELGEVLLEAYGPGVLGDMLRTWAGHEWLRPRLPILKEGVGCYRDGRYYAAVCTLLPQIEGVLGDALGEKPNAQNHASRLFDGGYCSNAARRYYVDVLNASARWGSGDCLPGSRHAVLHGIVTNYGTPTSALKVVVALDRVVAAAATYRRKQ